MSLEQDFRAAIIADPSVQPITGPRWWLVQKPPNLTASGYPCGTYQRVSTQRLYTQDGRAAGNQASRGWCRFQLVLWAAGANGGESVLALREAVLAFLQRFNAVQPPASPQTLSQAPNFVLQERMALEPQPEQPLAKYLIDVKVFFGPGQ